MIKRYIFSIELKGGSYDEVWDIFCSMYDSKIIRILDVTKIEATDSKDKYSCVVLYSSGRRNMENTVKKIGISQDNIFIVERVKANSILLPDNLSSVFGVFFKNDC